MADANSLAARLEKRFADALDSCEAAFGEVTAEISPERILEICTALRDEGDLRFEMLIDLCGADYAAYGHTEWQTEDASSTGFSRGVDRRQFRAVETTPQKGRRFAVVYHLLSLSNNARLRVRTYARDDEFPVVDSATGIWASADWYEREAFDLYGIVFDGHPDLRRLLTDYGFIGYPFRKDFPLSGHVEVRYDPERQRVVYEPVSIEPRILVPRVIRDDLRYQGRTARERSSDA